MGVDEEVDMTKVPTSTLPTTNASITTASEGETASEVRSAVGGGSTVAANDELTPVLSAVPAVPSPFKEEEESDAPIFPRTGKKGLSVH